jgi:hypothetical protein
VGYYVNFETKDPDEPLPREALKRLILADPEIREEKGAFVWRAGGIEEWFDLEVGAKQPTDELVGKWAAWAKELGLRIVGEDGEEFLLEDYLPPEAPPPKKSKSKKPVPYSPRAVFEVGDRIEHKTFGAGKVVAVAGKSIEVKFGSETKKLAQGLE